MSNELTLIEDKQYVTTLLKSSFFSHIKTIEQALIIIWKARELGIPEVQAFTSIAVINGKPSITAELMLSLIYKNCKTADIVYEKTDTNVCIINARRKDSQNYSKFQFSIEDAKTAGLTGKGPWRQYPSAMLRARCISAMARALFPDCLSGCVYTVEELGGSVNPEGAIDVTPKQNSSLGTVGEVKNSKIDDTTIKEPKKEVGLKTTSNESQKTSSTSLADPFSNYPTQPRGIRTGGSNDFVPGGDCKYAGKRLGEIPLPELYEYHKVVTEWSSEKKQRLSFSVIDVLHQIETIQIEEQNALAEQQEQPQ